MFDVLFLYTISDLGIGSGVIIGNSEKELGTEELGAEEFGAEVDGRETSLYCFPEFSEYAWLPTELFEFLRYKFVSRRFTFSSVN